jgi:hypothetical protein
MCTSSNAYLGGELQMGKKKGKRGKGKKEKSTD